MSDKPNILFLITDQQQKNTVIGSQCKIPNIDRLRNEGVFFSKAYSVNPICSPTRASLFTGLLPHNHGMVDCTHNVEEYRANYRSEKDTFTQHLKADGYRLGYYGKWHVERTMDLSQFGFDEYLTEADAREFPMTITKKLTVKQYGYNDRVVCGVYQEDSTQTEEHFIYSKGVEFIKKSQENQSQPWCLFLSTNGPHDPYLVPEDIYNLYNPKEIEKPANFDDPMEDKPAIYRRIKSVWQDLQWEDYQKVIACYYAYCSLIDTQVGRILKTLEETNQLKNTIIVYTTDHGDLMGGHGLFCKGVPPFEEVYNVPLIIRWSQGNLENKVLDTYVTTCDLAPTLLDMVGSKPMSGIDGASIVPYLKGDSDLPKRVAFAEFHGQRLAYSQRIVWKDNYKYVYNGFDFDEFYDLNKEPYELRNLINEPAYQDRVIDLCREMWNIVKKTGDSSFLQTEYYMFRFAPVGPEQQKVKSVYNKGA